MNISYKAYRKAKQVIRLIYSIGLTDMLIQRQIFRLIFVFSLGLSLFITRITFAFTDTSIPSLEQTIQKAKQGNKDAKAMLEGALHLLYKADLIARQYKDAYAKVKKLIDSGKVPAYILANGQYQYIEGNNAVYITGRNVRMRSQPNHKARVITTLNQESTEYLIYLGEWKSSTGNRWVFVEDNLFGRNPGKIGWIYGKHVNLISNVKFQRIIGEIEEVINMTRKETFHQKIPDSTSQFSSETNKLIPSTTSTNENLIFIIIILSLYGLSRLIIPHIDNNCIKDERKVKADWANKNIWATFGPNEDFYEFLRTTNSIQDVMMVFAKYIDLSQCTQQELLEATFAAADNPDSIVSSYINTRIRQALQS